VKRIRCETCGREAPSSDVFVVGKKPACRSCVETALGQAEYTREAVRPYPDPTVCIECRTDYGHVELGLLAGLPVCDACARKYRQRPFPMWVKIGFAAVLALAAISAVRNLRFIQGYIEYKQADRAFDAGDFDTAAEQMAAAADHVPEAEALRADAEYFRGIQLHLQDKDEEAVRVLKACRDRYGGGKGLDYWLLAAEGSLAFDAHDYEAFYQKAQEQARLEPDSIDAMAGLASATACKYAATGDEKFKRQAEELLAKVRSKIDKPDPRDEAFFRRMQHRLQTREIITREEYDRRFPEGHEKGGK
jgi:hypothetical protein